MRRTRVRTPGLRRPRGCREFVRGRMLKISCGQRRQFSAATSSCAGVFVFFKGGFYFIPSAMRCWSRVRGYVSSWVRPSSSAVAAFLAAPDYSSYAPDLGYGLLRTTSLRICNHRNGKSDRPHVCTSMCVLCVAAVTHARAMRCNVRVAAAAFLLNRQGTVVA